MSGAVPAARTVKEAGAPSLTVSTAGGVVMLGGVSTTSAALVLVTKPTALLTVTE